MLSHEQRASNQLDNERKVLLGQMEAAEGLGTDTAEIERMLADLKVQILEKGAERKAKSAEVCAGCNFGTVICLPCSFLSLAVSACHCAPPLLHQQAALLVQQAGLFFDCSRHNGGTIITSSPHDLCGSKTYTRRAGGPNRETAHNSHAPRGEMRCARGR